MAYPYYQYPNYNQMYYQQSQQQSTPQIQNGGFVSAPSMDYARSYPVAPGNSVTFKIESQPYICTKTLGFSQLDQPIFEIFKLVKEECAETSKNVLDNEDGQFLTIDEGNALKAEIDAVKSELQMLKELIESNKQEVVSA